MTRITLFAILFFVSASSFGAGLKNRYREGELLIRFKKSASTQSFDTKLNQSKLNSFVKLRRARNQKHNDWYHVKLQPNETVVQAIARLKQDPSIDVVQPNFKYRISAVPNDPLYSHLWGLKNTGQELGDLDLFGPGFEDSQGNPGVAGKDMNLQVAWDKITDCSSVVVAVVDTGINLTHEDLVANLWDGSGSGFPNHGYDVANSDNNPSDDNGHGTHVAGTIGAVGNNGIGTVGVCWNVKLMAVKIFDAAGESDSAKLAQGITWAVDHTAKVINLSLGGSDNDAVVVTAMEHARDNGVVTVVAAGNEGNNNSSSPMYPCNYRYPTNICVAALKQDYGLADFSNYSPSFVDVGAPGVNIASAWWTTRTVVTDNFAAGWTYVTTGSAWGPQSSTLTMPSNWNGSTVNYSNSTESVAYKTFNLAAYPEVWVDYAIRFSSQANDSMRPYVIAGTANPSPSGSLIETLSGSTQGVSYRRTYELSPECGSTTCSYGFRFTSNASSVSTGFSVSDFAVIGFAPGTDGYNLIEGTSMATPHVAGLAAMIFAYNPTYTAAEVVTAIKEGGKAVESLQGKTTTGKAADAATALSYIQAPTGVTATQGP